MMQVMTCMTYPAFSSRHCRACPGNPERLAEAFPRKAVWMPGTSPGMTKETEVAS